MDSRFIGKTIVITGAGGNFGREGCLFFASRGAYVAALDKNLKALKDTVNYVLKEMAKEASDNVISGFDCDVTDVNSVNGALDSAMKFFESSSGQKRIHLLWNNAGYQGKIAPTLEYDTVDFSNVMNINVTGMFIVLQSVAKRMAAEKEEEGGRGFSIVNTASVAGLRGTPAMVAYSSSKAAVLAMTVSTAKDLAPHGIRVNAVSPALIGPGYMWTRQNELHAKSGSPYFLSDPERVAEGKINSVPMKRLGSVEEVIKSVAFLLSDDSSYTTATNLVVDGGMSGGLKA
eukprot:CAMPEP_0195518210 /NCGR_PEP_ID=MMETSP0794_2-20130614/12581_1 /TAXON_ID=515487 /ORGANISM="Stephanopyxis turris, Strain CCMP 815" /LENGTH=287 /DNA_ID=CAMNT_0040647137 /DNA_START=166 /DNA_END=1029 /DNA_ORIENTATION=+